MTPTHRTAPTLPPPAQASKERTLMLLGRIISKSIDADRERAAQTEKRTPTPRRKRRAS